MHHKILILLMAGLAVSCVSKKKENPAAYPVSPAFTRPADAAPDTAAAPMSPSSPVVANSGASSATGGTKATPPTFTEDFLDGVWMLQRYECIGTKMPPALRQLNARIKTGQHKEIFRKTEQRVTVDIKKTADLKKPGTYCRGFRYEDWEIQGKDKLLVKNGTAYERGVGGDTCWASNKDPETRGYSFLPMKNGFKLNMWKNAMCAGFPTILVYQKVL